MKKNLFLGLGMILSLFTLSTVFASTNPLSNTSWALSSYNGSGASGTLSFDNSMMYSKFCNNVSQGYSYSDGKIVSQGNGISTLMYCQGLPMTLEDNFSMSTGTTVVMSGTQMTITTFAKNIYAFIKHEDKPVICTKEYMPVCGQVQVQCIKAPCNPIQETFGNACMAKAVGAIDIIQGECENTFTGHVVGGDNDEYRCKGSAGYSWNVAKGQCTRSREDNVKTSCKMIEKDLQMYSKDKSSVKALQSQLRKLGYFKIKLTGNFGVITKKAIQQFQKDNGIQTTGKLGSVTRHALQQVCSNDRNTSSLGMNTIQVSFLGKVFYLSGSDSFAPELGGRSFISFKSDNNLDMKQGDIVEQYDYIFDGKRLILKSDTLQNTITLTLLDSTSFINENNNIRIEGK